MSDSLTFKLQHKIWKKDNYFISTDPALIPLKRMNEILASKDVYWAKSMPESVLAETLQNSLCFGLYQSELDPENNTVNTGESPLFIGIARCITDFTTFLYLTDVYIDPQQQGSGLGSWLIRCVQEAIDSMPHLRRSLLFTSDWERSVPFYERLMGMTVLESRRSSDGKTGEGVAVLMRIGKGHPNYVESSAP